MTLYELFAVQRDKNTLKSLYLELAKHEDLNPFKANIITDMPRGGGGKDIGEWYTEEKERILKRIEFYKRKIQEDRRILDEYIAAAPFPECDIIRFRVINDMSWEEIGAEVGYTGRNTSRRFYNYVGSCPKCP